MSTRKFNPKVEWVFGQYGIIQEKGVVELVKHHRGNSLLALKNPFRSEKE